MQYIEDFCIFKYNKNTNLQQIEVRIVVKDTIQAVKQAETDATKLAKETAKKQEQMMEEAKQQVVILEKELQEKVIEEREKALKAVVIQNEVLLEKAKEQALEEVKLLKEQAACKRAEVYQIMIKELV